MISLYESSVGTDYGIRNDLEVVGISLVPHNSAAVSALVLIHLVYLASQPLWLCFRRFPFVLLGLHSHSGFGFYPLLKLLQPIRGVESGKQPVSGCDWLELTAPRNIKNPRKHHDGNV